ncbi:MAG: Gfo/Idh/MocA family oxidoreductase [Hyphomicrobiales bacterium]
MNKIKYGMVGGGQGAFIGAVHRIAARMDDHFQLVAGALSSTAEKSKASGKELGISEGRAYGDFSEMALAEAAREDGIEVVAIVTPNHMHFPVAKAFLEAGIHVICDKPMTTTVEDAEELAALVEKTGKVFVLTHNYSGYPMIRQARAMVQSGELGTIQLVQAEYAQDWLTEALEGTGQKQAAWRTDPKQSGIGGCVGDIGTHAFHLGNYVSGLKTEKVAADMTTFVPGRDLDDNIHVMLRYENGAKGMIWASQVAPGNENALKLRVYGTKGGIEWEQENPNILYYTPYGKPKQVLTRGGAGSGEEAGRVSRTPPGHPEGYLEGFANIYSEAAAAIKASRTGQIPDKEVHFPTVADGVEGVRFITACVTSGHADAEWTQL